MRDAPYLSLGTGECSRRLLTWRVVSAKQHKWYLEIALALYEQKVRVMLMLTASNTFYISVRFKSKKISSLGKRATKLIASFPPYKRKKRTYTSLKPKNSIEECRYSQNLITGSRSSYYHRTPRFCAKLNHKKREAIYHPYKKLQSFHRDMNKKSMPCEGLPTYHLVLANAVGDY